MKNDTIRIETILRASIYWCSKEWVFFFLQSVGLHPAGLSDDEAEFFLDDERPRSRYYVTAIKKCDFLSPFKFMFMFSIINLS